MNSVYLLLGSNMGNSEEQLAQAIMHIENKAGRLLQRSSIYQTAAWGLTDQPDFLNQVILISSALDAVSLLNTILDIEKEMGRIRTIKNAPRVIDIDILFFNNDIINLPQLKVPHPEIPNRRFVLIPLNEMNAGLQHPSLHQTIHNLLLHCPDKLDVKKFYPGNK